MSRGEVEAAMEATRSMNTDDINRANEFLRAWEESPESAPTALEIIRSGGNQQNISMACIILARKVRNNWMEFPPDFRVELKGCLQELVLTTGENPILCRSAAMALCAIACFETPDFLREVFSVQPTTPEVLSVQLTLLVAFGDELGGDGLLRERKNELRNIFASYSGQIKEVIRTGIKSGMPHTERLAFSLLNYLAKWSDIGSFDLIPLVPLAIHDLPKYHECVLVLNTVYFERCDAISMFKQTANHFCQFFCEHEDILERNLDFVLQVLQTFHNSFRGEIDINLVRRLHLNILRCPISDENSYAYFHFWSSIVREIRYSTLFDWASKKGFEIFHPLLPDFCTELTKHLTVVPNLRIARECIDLLSRIGTDFRTLVLSSELSIELTYAIGAIELNVKWDNDPEFMAKVCSCLQGLFSFVNDPCWTGPAFFALSRHFRVAFQNEDHLAQFTKWIIAAVASGNSDQRGHALRALSRIYKKYAVNFSHLKAEQFTMAILQCLHKVLEGLTADDEEEIETLVKTMCRVVTSLSNRQAAGLYDWIGNFLVKYMNDAPPAAMALISDVAFCSGDGAAAILKRCWKPLFVAMKSDTLLFEPAFMAIIDCICACYRQNDISDQIREFTAVLSDAPTDLVLTAVFRLRQLSDVFEFLCAILEERIIADEENALTPNLFGCFSVFSPSNLKMPLVMQMVWKGILRVERPVCEAALDFLEEHIRTLTESERGPFAEQFLRPVLQAVISSMFDGLHGPSIGHHCRVLRLVFLFYRNCAPLFAAEIFVECGMPPDVAQASIASLVECQDDAAKFKIQLHDILLQMKVISYRDYSRVLCVQEELSNLSIEIPGFVDPNNDDLPVELMRALTVL